VNTLTHSTRTIARKFILLPILGWTTIYILIRGC